MRIKYGVLIFSFFALLFAVGAGPAAAADSREALERAYRAYQQAVLAKNWDKIVKNSSAETGKDMQTYPKDKRGKAMGFMHQMMDYTKNSKVDSAKFDGTKGTLKVHVPQKKGSLTGEILLRKEQGRWRVHTQKWNEKD